MGQLQGAQWQVVGFQHRMGTEPGDDEHFGWSEYLLYNKKRGFSFVGPTTAYALMQATGMVDDHIASCWVPAAQ